MFILRIMVKNEYDTFTFDGEIGRRFIHYPCDTELHTGKEAVGVALTKVEYDLKPVFTQEEINLILEAELFNTEVVGVPDPIPESVSVEHPHLTITLHSQYEVIQ